MRFRYVLPLVFFGILAKVNSGFGVDAPVASVTLSVSPSAAPAAEPIGVVSSYTAAIEKFQKNWEQESSKTEYAEKIKLQCFSDPKSEFAIGVRQSFQIHAPIATVLKVLDTFSDYTALFDGMAKAEVREEFKGGFVFFTEQDIPVPFVANERNEMIYRVEKPSDAMKVYRYQLKKSNHLKYNDGIILVKSKSPDITLYDEVDFWDADLGIAKTFGAKKVWKDSLEGIEQADLAVQMKAEGPELANKKILETSKKQAADQSSEAIFDSCIQTKKSFSE